MDLGNVAVSEKVVMMIWPRNHTWHLNHFQWRLCCSHSQSLFIYLFISARAFNFSSNNYIFAKTKFNMNILSVSKYALYVLSVFNRTDYKIVMGIHDVLRVKIFRIYIYIYIYINVYDLKKNSSHIKIINLFLSC